MRAEAPASSGTIGYFKHCPLRQDDQQIRLVRILPPDRTTEQPERSISCHIEHYDLFLCAQICTSTRNAEMTSPVQAGDMINNVLEADSPTRYVALSYTWGDEESARTIYIHGLPFTVRRNLYSFLCVMQDRGVYDTLFWIDLLSINQSDTLERSRQVAMMANIYAGASSVYVWLGLDTPRTQTAFSLLEEYTAASRLADEEEGRRLEPLKRFKDALRALGHEKLDWDLLAEIFDRPYWTRLWVVQEVCLARYHLNLLCGPYSYSLPRLHSEEHPLFDHLYWLIVMQQEEMNKRTYDRMFQAIELLYDREYFEDGGFSLGEALVQHCLRDCADPCDTVFGLQACVRPDQRIPADYALGIEAIFQKVLDVVQSPDASATLTNMLFPRLRRQMGLPPHGRVRLMVRDVAHQQDVPEID